MRSFLVTLGVLVAVATVAACGGSSGEDESAVTTTGAVDTQEVEELLVATQKRASPDFDVRDPSCPARVVIGQGTSFQCTVVVDGVIVPYQVTLAEIGGPDGAGRYELRPAKAILSIPKLVDALQRNNPGSRVDCGPDRVKALDVGATFDCTVTPANGTPQPVKLKVDDLQGTVSQA